MKQYQVSVRPRHFRHMFFIEETTSYEKLYSLIIHNQSIWGGWHNPIVPVRNGIINDSWLNIISHYDPDFIFHSKKIDPEIIYRLRLFNPIRFVEIDEDLRVREIEGVDVYNFLSQYQAKSNIILSTDTWKTKSPLLSFYKLNFGLEEHSFQHQFELSRGHNITQLSCENFHTINKLIYELRPIIPSQLSRNNLNTKILRSRTHLSSHFEIVVAKDKTNIEDLLYYWNRKLFELRRILYCTLEEIDLLCEDEYFGKVLEQLDYENTIHIVSLSLTQKEIEEIINTKFKTVSRFIRFEVQQNTRDFPFEVLDANGLYEREYGEAICTTVIPRDESIIQLPELSFTKNPKFSLQSWVVDIEMTEYGRNYKNEIKFPLTTNTRYIIKEHEGRINLRRNISIIASNHQKGNNNINILIPSFEHLARQLIINPVLNGQSINNSYAYAGNHDDSNKLNALINLFDQDLHTLEDFFSDEFWMNIFEVLSTSEKAAGDSISFHQIVEDCKARFHSKGIIELTEEGRIQGNKKDTHLNEENLIFGLKYTMDELCHYRVFLKGYRIKCPHCSSRFWYSINDVGESLTCKGCQNNYELPVEPDFAYKLNDLVKNNIFNTSTSRSGNLTVLRTLALLSQNSLHSFGYGPQLNLYSNVHTKDISGEIDIFCIADGKLIIGEAKHDSKAFSENKNKSLESLVNIAKAIRPDKIVLSCYEDSNGKLAKAKQGVVHYFNKWEYQPEIETILLSKPDDFHFRGHRYFYY